MGIDSSILHKNSLQKGEFVNQVIVCKKIDMDLSKANTFIYWYIHVHVHVHVGLHDFFQSKSLVCHCKYSLV